MSQKIIILLISMTIMTAAADKSFTLTPTDVTVPQLINYQGKLTDVSGNAVRDSIYSITFRFFPTSVGGTAFWNETQSVQTHAGLFNYLLGSVTSISDVPADGNCYLEMQVNPNPAMTPRVKIVSAAYSFLSKKADSANYAVSAPLVRPITPPITNSEISDSVITSQKISDNAVTTSKILNMTIQGEDIANTTIGQEKLSFTPAIRPLTPPISTDEISDSVITGQKIADNAVTTSKIQNMTIQGEDIANTTIGQEKLSFAPATRPLTPPISTDEISDGMVTTVKIADGAIINQKIADNGVTSTKISDGTITRSDVASSFKAPYSDTSDYARAVSVQYVDSSRIATNSYKLQGKDTIALSAKFVDEGQTNAISSSMIADSAVTTAKLRTSSVTSTQILDGTIARIDVTNNFKAPYSDTSDYARAVSVQYVDSSRIATNAYKLQGKDTNALDSRYVNEAQNNSVSTGMISNNAVTMEKINQSGAATGQVIKWNGTAWEPKNDSIGGEPSGPAGGDLTGTYPNPVIANNVVDSTKITDGSISGSNIVKPLKLQASASWPNAILHITNNEAGQGISIDRAGYVGLYVKYAFADGIGVERADQSGLAIDTAGGSAIRVFNATFDGIGIDEIGYNGLYVMHAGDNGLKTDSSESFGAYTYGNIAGGNFVAGNPSATGLVAHAYGDVSTDTAIQAYGKGFATGGFYTGGLLDNKSAPCLISPELGIVAAGTGTLVNGEADIDFNSLFTENIRTDVPIRITVTPKGKPAGFLYVAETKSSGFKVAMEQVPGLEKNSGNVTFDWIAYGTLKEFQTSPEAQAQWQNMIKERDAKRSAAKARDEQRIKKGK